MLSPFFTRSNDPQRLAIRSLWVIGTLSVIVGACVVYLLGIANPYRVYRRWFLAGGTLIWLAPGILYLASIPSLRAGKLGALVIALVAAGFQALCAAGFIVANLVLRPISPTPLLLSMLWFIAMIEVLLRLRGCFIRIQSMAVDYQRGFEALPATPQATAEEARSVVREEETHRPGSKG